jgi:hypothetical protein
MTTSGITADNPVRDRSIKRALRMINAYASTDEPRPEQMTDALETLNSLLKSWQVEGFLWLKQFATLTCVAGQARYDIPGAETLSDETGQPIPRPTRIDYLTRRATSSSSDLPMGENGRPVSRSEYAAQPNKAAPGLPLMAYYDPQLETGALYLWPTPSTSLVQVRFSCDRPIQDMIADTDTFDVPQEQVRRIEYALALELAPEYALPAGDYDRLKARYLEISSALSDFDRETAETYFMPGRH